MTDLLSEKDKLIEALLSLFVQDNDVVTYFKQEPKDKETLRVGVRIVVDFFYFLKNSPSEIHPSQPEVDYINDTIRSGIDFFYDVRDFERIVTNRTERMFEWRYYNTFAALKADFLLYFDNLQVQSITTQERLYILLVLTRLVLLFWATTFVE